MCLDFGVLLVLCSCGFLVYVLGLLPMVCLCID